MALIELELGKPNFEAMALLALSASPIPGPTFTAIGADRLLASMKWTSATLVSSVPGSASGPGAVLTKSSVEIRHVSVDELLADPNATGSTVTGTAWVHWTLTLAGLQGRLIRLEAAQSQVWQQGLMICERRFRPPLAVMKSAMLAGPKSITLRYATVNSDDLLVPAANRLDEADGSWHLHVSSGVFVDEMTTLFSKILTPPPSGMEIEDALNVTWTSVGGGGGGWGVRAQVGLEKIDACPALIEDVDVSVDITTTLQLVPDPGKETLGQRLRVEGDASDWDVFRCWAGSGGLGSFVLISLGTGLVGIGAAVGSLALIGGIVQDGIAKEIAKLDAGPLKLVESDDSSRTFAGSRALPGRGIGSINSASTGPEGLSVKGSLPPIIPVTHQASFHPNSDPVDGAWAGDYVCGVGGLGGGWQQRFCWNPILISDRAVILAGLVDKTYAWVPVTVFPTSMATPAPGWHIDHDDPVSDQVVTVTGDEWLAGGGEGFLILHTSAGIRRYRMDVPAAPPSPSPVIIAQHAAKCLKWTEVFLDPQQEIKWLADPPPYDFGRPPLRQWQLTFASLPAAASLVLRARGGGKAASLLELRTGPGGPASLEVITDATTELELESSMREATQARVQQRWLLPRDSVAFDANVKSIVRSGDNVVAVTDNDMGHLVNVSERLKVMTSTSGVTSALRDREGLLMWGQSGVFRILDGRLQSADEAVPSTRQNGDGPCVLYSESNQQPQSSILRSIPLRRNRVLAAVDRSIIIATPFEIKRKK